MSQTPSQLPSGFEDDPERPSTASPSEAVLQEEMIGNTHGHDPYAAFRLGNFRKYALGIVIGTIGFQMQSVAVAWEMYQWTGSAKTLAWVGLVMALPMIFFTLPSGHLADRYDRRWVTFLSLLCISFFAGAMGWVAWAHAHGQLSTRASELIMYGLLFGSASSASFGRPAREALLPQVIPAEIFPNAITWNSSLSEMSSMVGPALGGVAILWGASTVFFLNAVSTLVYAAMLLSLRVTPVPRKVEPASLHGLLAGIRFVFSTRLMLATMTLDLFAVLLGGATYLLPIFAKDILHVGPAGFGWLRAAPAFGAFTMAILLAHRPPMRRSGRNLLLAVAGFGAATIVFGLSHNFVLSLVMLFFTGMFDNVSVVVRHTLVQLLTPDAMRGRVSAVNQVFIGSSNEIGGLESGLTASWLGPVVSVVGGGIGTILVVCAVAIKWREVRELKALHDVTPLES